MESNKYYTPKIEEFYVGFEFEEESISKLMYHKKTFRFEWFDLQKEIIYGLDNNKIRVKYLDQEDIESLGFKETGDSERNELSLESKTNIGGPSAGDDFKYIILYSLNNKEAWIYKKHNNGWEDDLFKGYIKNKSELKKLLKQLKINE